VLPAPSPYHSFHLWTNVWVAWVSSFLKAYQLGHETKDNLIVTHMPLVRRCGWLGGRKGIRPVKSEWWVRCWLRYLPESELQMACIWSSWCHCHPIIICSSKIHNGLPFWCRLTQVVLEKRPLNKCSSVAVVIVAQPTMPKHWGKCNLPYLYLCLNGWFPGECRLASSSTCFGKEPLCISGTGFSTDRTPSPST